MLQIVVSSLLYFTPRTTRLYGTFASFFAFFQFYVLMVPERKLRAALVDEINPDHDIAKGERLLVMAVLLCFFFTILV